MRWNRLFLMPFIIMAVIVLFQEMPVAGLVVFSQRLLNMVQIESELEAQSLTIKNKLTAVKKELSAAGLSASQQSRLMSLQSQLDRTYAVENRSSIITASYYFGYINCQLNKINELQNQLRKSYWRKS